MSYQLGTLSKIFFRRFSTHYIPFQVPKEQATLSFEKFDRQSKWQPLLSDLSKELIWGKSVTQIQKMYVPTVSATVSVLSAHFTGTRVDKEGKENPIEGKYPGGTLKMGAIYTGGALKSAHVAKIFLNINAEEYPFKKECVDAETILDPQVKSEADLKGIIDAKIYRFYGEEINNSLSEQGVKVRNIKVSIHYAELQMHPCRLPLYRRCNPGREELVLSGLGGEVTGNEQISLTKSYAYGASITLGMLIFFDADILSISGLAMLGLGGSLGRRWILVKQVVRDNNFETLNIYRIGEAPKPHFLVDRVHYEVLGLDPFKPVTVEMVRKNFAERIQKAHPDHKGDDEMARKLIEAKKIFLESIARN